MKSEKEKMLSGELYYAPDKELTAERLRNKELCFKYNNISPKNVEERLALIKKIIGKTGQNCIVESPFMCDYGYNIKTGENFYANHNLIILDCAEVTFGNNVLIGPNCSFYTAEHPIDPIERNKEIEYAKPVTVGSNVWFGGSVTVLGGVTIGDNVVIGAGSVVVHDIPSDSIALGNPARVIKKTDR